VGVIVGVLRKNMEDSTEWDMMEDEEDDNSDRKRKLVNIYINGKSRFMASVYNLYRRYPSMPPPFTLSPIFMFGTCYQCDSSIAQFHLIDNDSSSSNNYWPHVTTFLRKFRTVIWFSYRKDFPPLGPAQITSDIGWGCMLRTGQMLLAQCLIFHFLGTDWHLSPQDVFAPFSQYRQILRLFTDAPGQTYPFSIHNIVMKNKALARKQKDVSYKVEAWFAPSVISRVLRSLVHQLGPETLSMYVPSDGVVYIDKVTQICTQPKEKSNARTNVVNHSYPHPQNVDESFQVEISGEGSDAWNSLLILIPIRLGVDRINPIYFKSLLTCLRFPQSIGIIGGKPKQSFYFVGAQDEHLVYLDPHIVHESVRIDQEFSDETYHCAVPQKMHVSDVDPSLAIGFYCRTRIDFCDLCSHIKKMGLDSDPVLGVQEKQPVYGSDEEDDDFSELS